MTYEYIYKTEWYLTPKSTEPAGWMYFLHEKDTRWVHDWKHEGIDFDHCKIMVIRVPTDSAEYSAAVQYSANTDQETD